VGCGAGADTIPLQSLVGPFGRVVGVDYDRAMLSRARVGADVADGGEHLLHVCSEAMNLPLESDMFDSCRSERLFQHLTHPELVIGEMLRVTKPGGHVVVLDTDHGTWSVDTPYKDIERRITRFKAEHFGNNGYAGRQLYRLFRQTGLKDLSCEIVSGYFTDYELARFMFRLAWSVRKNLLCGATVWRLPRAEIIFFVRKVWSWWWERNRKQRQIC